MAGLYESLFGTQSGNSNAYVQNNWPDETGNRIMYRVRPETFYTPDGLNPPPGGRGPTIGEAHQGAPNIYKMLPFLMSLMQERGLK